MARKFSIDKRKVKALYKAMLHGGVQVKYVAYNLGMRENTVRSWIEAGKALQENFDEKLDELYDIFPYMYMDLWENKKLQFEEEFKQEHEIEDKIPDRLYLAYTQFMETQRKIFIEDNISRKEKEILDEVEFTGDEETDEQYRLLIRFSRIYERGICTTEMTYLSNINKHCATSKNVALSLKMLEKSNKEDFADQQYVTHQGAIDVNTKSILSLALNYEKNLKEQQRLPQNEIQAIDVEEIKQIENKN